MNSRRKFIQHSVLVGGTLILTSEHLFSNTFTPLTAEFTLPTLPYQYDALAPVIDKTTMEIHHSKHHQAYVNNLNKALEEKTDSIENICANIDKYSIAVRNNGGGHYNHTLFWSIMTPKQENLKEGKLKSAIESSFGSLEKMKELFTDVAIKRFGSGWAWLIADKNGKLSISSTPNQDNPLMPVVADKGYPILALDVWEHAYYLQYQNRRSDYVKAWWQLVNWQEAEKRYHKIRI